MVHISEKTLNAWVDGMLPGREADEVEAHLAVCPSCNGAAEELRRLCRAIEALPPAPGAESLARQTVAVWKKLRPGPGRRRPRPEPGRRWMAFAFAAVAVGLLVGVVLGGTAAKAIAPGLVAESRYSSNGTYETGAEPPSYLQLLVTDDGGEL